MCTIGTCYGHVMSKACAYGTTNEKVCLDMKEMFLKKA